MRAHTKGIEVLFLSLVAMVSCDGTDTGNPYVQPLIVDAHSTNLGSVSIQEDLGGTVVTEAWLSIDEISLFDAKRCDTTPVAQIPPIGIADHAAADALHLTIELPEDSYCSLTIPRILAAASAGIPDPVVGTSVYLAGTTAAGRAFVVRSVSTETTTASAPSGSFELSPDLGGLFLGFDVATWLSGIDLDGAVVNGEGVIVLDATNNILLLEAFESNLAAGTALFRDQNGNGQIDGPEDERLATGQSL
jgi:hypothetical protein